MINSSDTAWILISAALVLLMTPGLALFYGGMVKIIAAVQSIRDEGSYKFEGGASWHTIGGLII